MAADLLVVRRIMLHVVGGEQLRDDIQVSLGEDLLEVPPDHRLVPLGHRSLLLADASWVVAESLERERLTSIGEFAYLVVEIRSAPRWRTAYAPASPRLLSPSFESTLAT